MIKKRTLLEVAIGSVDDALAAQAGGADRLELNAALELAGLTPSLGTLLEVKQAVSLPVMVMIRPRAGNFVYGARHFQVMLRDLDLVLEHGADGIVFGILTADGGVDGPRCREVVRRTGRRQTVFHRAFDLTPDPLASLQTLIDLGVQRVLTSGQETTAMQGAGLIARLHAFSAGRIEILPAAGINPHNVRDVLQSTCCNQVHATLKVAGHDQASPVGPREAFRGFGTMTDADAVAGVRKVLDTCS